MKIILLRNLRGHKRDEIITVADGYAEFLMSTGQALQANTENINALNKKIKTDAETRKREISTAYAYADKLNGKVITIIRKSSPRGIPVNTVTKADVLTAVNELLDKYKMEHSINQKQIEMDILKTYGMHKVGIDLDKEVKIVVNVQIVGN